MAITHSCECEIPFVANNNKIMQLCNDVMCVINMIEYYPNIPFGPEWFSAFEQIS